MTLNTVLQLVVEKVCGGHVFGVLKRQKGHVVDFNSMIIRQNYTKFCRRDKKKF